ncbi:hypothetical protein MLD38_019855 [Melastoma candidum]|uniref:Uncharacterized protein n=1 Tax=Melastoma candidum TaxID=119954 RepID=A0ACB9QBP1_9MYRT|nr:hypothetical protein MLD38_019855 [Melastoma candidum]
MRGSSSRFSKTILQSRIPALMFSMVATFASIYVAGRLWQESQNRVYLIKELDRLTGQGQSAIQVDDALKVIACREQRKKLSDLELELTAARQEGFATKRSYDSSKKTPMLVIGVFTTFGGKKNRDAVRKAWMGTGSSLRALEEKKGIIARFVIGRSANRGDSLDMGIDAENRQTEDFIILDDVVEAPDETPKKAKLFFAHVAEKWEAEFYSKTKDNVFVNIDGLMNILAAQLMKPRVYIGCMKSGEVFSEKGHKWYEPDWWKFGDKKTYFRYASGEIYVISWALAKFISINRSMLRSYAHDDVSAGSWFIGLDVTHIDEGKFCCSSWPSGAICSGI